MKDEGFYYTAMFVLVAFISPFLPEVWEIENCLLDRELEKTEEDSDEEPPTLCNSMEDLSDTREREEEQKDQEDQEEKQEQGEQKEQSMTPLLKDKLGQLDTLTCTGKGPRRRSWIKVAASVENFHI